MPRPGGVSRYTRSYRPTTSRSRYTDTGSNGKKTNTSRNSMTSSKAGMPTNIPKISKPAPLTPYKKVKSPVKTVSTPRAKPKTTSVESKAGIPTNIPVNTKQKKQLPASKAGMPTDIQNRTTNSASGQFDVDKNKKTANKYAKIYSKPSEKPSSTDSSKGIKKELEDISLSAGSMKPILPEKKKNLLERV